MKILIVHNYYRFRGGEDRSVDLQSRALAEEGHQLLVYTRDSREIDGPGVGRMMAAGVNVVYSRRTYTDLRRLVRRERPDVAHVHNLFPLISISAIHALADLGVPVVVTHHNYRLVCANGLLFTNGAVCSRCPSARSVLPGIWYKCVQGKTGPSLAYGAAVLSARLLGSYSRCVDLHVYPSKTLRAWLSPHLHIKARAAVIPHFLPDRVNSNGSTDRPRLVFLGRVSAEKGIAILLKAAALLPGFEFDIVGDGPVRQSCQDSLPSSLKTRIRFHGAINDESRFDILGRARALVVPSLCLENLPYSVLEAYRAGVPVIASDIGGLAEAVTDGESGLLFRPGDAEGLATAVRSLHDDRGFAARLSMGARRQYEERYTLPKGCQALMSIYESVRSRARGEGA